ncbi:MAG: UDP-N-acetylmuramoylalanyl-D-glutamyl-2,6-diaminopimelate--D-alanyl-D-alanine ligase [Pseudomonadota bacterium]
MLWTRDDLVAATGGEASGDWQHVGGISIDTRTIQRGDLFVALQGDHRDGHEFIAQALDAGAAAVLVQDWPEDLTGPQPRLMVENTMQALQALGHEGRARTRAKVIAVTGSVGKTSTKEMLAAMLSPQGATHAAEKSYNNHWGVPLTLARMPAATEFAVIEIGMNHAGEITPLSRMARPDVAIVTTVEAVHLAAFNDVGEIADAKAEIFAGLGPEGVAILNTDNPYHDRLAAQTEARKIGFGADGDLRLISAEIAGQATILKAELHGQPLVAKIGAPGRHFARNALAALGAVGVVGGDLARAALELSGWSPPDGRGQRARILLGPKGIDGEITLIDESYNANPASMRAALEVLAAASVTDNTGRIEKGRRIAFLGDMLELGPAEADMHASLADSLQGIQIVHCCGPLMRHLHDALPSGKRGEWAGNSAALAGQIPRLLDAGDVAMVKGSLGSAMARVVSAIHTLGAQPGAEER